MSTNRAMVTHADATNPDEGNPVTIQVGVLATDPDSDDGHTVALKLADTPVVTVTDPTANELAELLTEAVAERAIYAEQTRQRTATALAPELSGTAPTACCTGWCGAWSAPSPGDHYLQRPQAERGHHAAVRRPRGE